MKQRWSHPGTITDAGTRTTMATVAAVGNDERKMLSEKANRVLENTQEGHSTIITGWYSLLYCAIPEGVRGPKLGVANKQKK